MIGVWIALCAFLELIIGAHDPLGFFLLFIGLIFVPYLWGSFQHMKLSRLLTSNYKAIHSIYECLIYNYECIRLANNCCDAWNLQLL